MLYLFAMPLVAAWTVLPDRSLRREVPPRAREPAVAIMLRELEQRGVWHDVTAYGHVIPELLVESPVVVQGDERMRSKPQAGWVLLEDPDEIVPNAEKIAADLQGYAPRVRLRLHDKSVVLKERQ
jgi:hypothetical protein